MTKTEFLAEIREKIQGLPQSDIEKFLDYYAEMIDDYTEDGCSAEQAIAELGTVDEIVNQILKETPLPRLVQEKVRPSRALCAGEIVLLILGSPIWLPLVFTVALLFFCAYALVWMVVVLLYAIDAAVLFGGVAGVFCLLPFSLAGNFPQGVFTLGAGLVCIGIGLLFFFVCNKVTFAVLRGSRWFLLRIKYAFAGKGEKK